MSIKTLIDIAANLQNAYDSAIAVIGYMAVIAKQIKTAIQTVNQAIHDDLVANGPCCIVDNSTSPPTATIYTPVDPDSFAATPVRVADGGTRRKRLR